MMENKQPFASIVENTWFPAGYGIDHGWGNGYVHIPEGHPWFGKECEHIDVDIHGGLTFSEMKDDMWVIGFDTCHYMDTVSLWPKWRVQQEADNLLQQVINASKP